MIGVAQSLPSADHVDDSHLVAIRHRLFGVLIRGHELTVDRHHKMVMGEAA